MEEDIDQLVLRLNDTKLPSTGVSFAGKGLKLNSSQDAQPVVDAINSCKVLEYLNLEGNTIGVEAAVAISKALESHSEFKQALWKDMFTGRLKEEIPKALKAMCGGLMKAKAKLEILDLSDNASGPIGVDGIADFIKSPSCFTLKELRLNNMGIGITGAEMLSEALLDCLMNAETSGHSLKLEVFIAGRNRLENAGIKALSQVFKRLDSLQELTIPQNGIYSLGIEALCDALTYNVHLKKLNLNDNSLCVKGAQILANTLCTVRGLLSLDIGDCIIGNDGALDIAKTLTYTENIQEVNVSFNSIKVEGAIAIIDAVKSKKSLQSLKLDGNQFGTEGKEIITNKVKQLWGDKQILDSLDEDEGSADEDVEDESVSVDDENEGGQMYDGEEEVEEEEDEDVHEECENRDIGENNVEIVDKKKTTQAVASSEESVTSNEIINIPIIEHLLTIGPGAGEKIIEEIKNENKDDFSQIEEIISAIMLVSSFKKAVEGDISEQLDVPEGHMEYITRTCTDRLYKEVFNIALRSNSLSTVNNALPVFLGLIKGEKKTPKLFHQDSCIATTKAAMKKDYFPKETSQLLEFILSSKSGK